MSFSTTVTIKTFPVELLTIIFCFVGPSSLSDPYPYLPLCWVCHQWRDIVLNDSRFWSVLIIGKDMNWGLNNEVIHRSNSRALDIIILQQKQQQMWGTYSLDVLNRLNDFAYSNDQLRTRIRSLFFPKDPTTGIIVRYADSPVCLFPRLERFTGSCVDVDDGKRLVPILAASNRLRYAELPWDTLSRLHKRKLLHHLSHLEWLVTVLPATTQPASSELSEILECLPNLQILSLSQKNIGLDPSPNSGNVPQARPVITLPKLRLLSLDFDINESWSFHAPKLDYLCVLTPGKERFRDWSLLENIELSEISSILIGNHAKIVGNHTGTATSWKSRTIASSFACISGSVYPQLDCLSYKTFHYAGLDSQAAMDGHLDLPNKSSFHLSMPYADLQAFGAVLTQATNLVELTVNYGSTKGDFNFSSLVERIFDSTGTGITRLNMVRGRSFAEACDLLADGRKLSRLERFVYHNAFTVRVTTFVPRRMEKLQNARLDAGSSPLKILELRNFVEISSEGVQRIKDLGIHLIQTA